MQVGAAAGFRHVVSLDMGGTSTDIALGEEGRVLEQTAGRIDDWEIGVPMLRIHTIGAGGGTIAWLDGGGILQVGPHSAGADPGPVCYDLGGAQPTMTDANVVLGFLHPQHLLGGRVKLNSAKARHAIAELGGPLGLDLLQTAAGMVRIINAKMEEGIRAVSTELGYDLRDFALVAFGGAGPVHAGRLAADLGMGHVVIPPMPGVTSALGLLMADPRRDYVRSRLRLLSELDVGELNRLFAEMRDLAGRECQADGFPPGQLSLTHAMDLRYLGQGYELTVPIPGDGHLAPEDLGALRSRFDDQHQQLFGHSARGEPVEAVNYRLRATVAVTKATLKRHRKSRTGPERALIGERQVFFEGAAGMHGCPVYDRARLSPGHTLRGPAIIDQLDATTVVYPGQTAAVDGFKNLVITVG
jgi:N-methylhydantoinase A